MKRQILQNVISFEKPKTVLVDVTTIMATIRKYKR